MRPVARRGLTLLMAAAAVVGLAACNDEAGSIADQARRGNNANYVEGDGGIEAVAAAKRAGPVSLEGVLLDGTPWKLTDQRGKVVVVNVWGSWCAPCTEEFPTLQKAFTQLTSQPATRGVVFIGINIGDSPANGLATSRAFGLGYPSLSDESRVLTLGLQGKANATPTTLVLDRQGRIAARVSGPITSEATLRGLVEDVVKEG